MADIRIKRGKLLAILPAKDIKQIHLTFVPLEKRHAKGKFSGVYFRRKDLVLNWNPFIEIAVINATIRMIASGVS